jgi:hypothetical protein
MNAAGPAPPAPRRPNAGSQGTPALPFDLPSIVRVLDGAAEVDIVPVRTTEPLDDLGDVRLAGAGARFAAVGRWRRRHGSLERWDVELEVTLTAGPALDAGVQVAVRLGPTDDPHWLIPGLFYGENRPESSNARYPRFADPGPHDPFAARAWGFRADRAATPVIFARDGERGLALATRETGPLGLNGVGFAAEAGGELRLAFPYREEPVAYDGSPDPSPPDRPTHLWQPGETVTLTFQAYVTPAEPYAWGAVLEDMRRELAATSALQPWLEPRAAAALAAEGLLRWHYEASPPVLRETADFDRHGDDGEPAAGDRDAMHVAWLSGTPAAAALLAYGRRAGDAAAQEAGAAVLDHIASNLAPCGTFWGRWTADRGWTKGWTPGEDALHARTLAEATLFMARAAALADDARTADRWRDAVRSNLEFVAARQRADGAIPAAWNARTGEPLAWAGCAGLAWTPALVEGARLLERDDLLEPARRAGEHYARFVDAELLYGAPEDVDLGPTSEDGYVAVMAYVALAEAAAPGPERDRWLDLAMRAAEWMLTFRYAWNVAFDPATTLGMLDYRTRGMDQASPANQHLHTYGLIAVSETVRLARMTGDERLLERAREHFAAARQLIARFDGDFGARRGMVPERPYQTACFGPKGEIGRLSHAWCLGLLLWACEAASGLPELTEAAA